MDRLVEAVLPETAAILEWPIAKQASRAPHRDVARRLNVTIVRGYAALPGGPNVAAQDSRVRTARQVENLWDPVRELVMP
jgi:hypothetical protein